MTSDLILDLDAWRLTLPMPLRWADDGRYSHNALSPNWPLGTPPSPETDIRMRLSDTCLNIGLANLQTRYYQARSLLLRPYLYRMMFGPLSPRSNDRVHCGQALQSMLWWPLFVAPSKDMKRLVPHHSTWTQGAIDNLRLFALIRHNDGLKRLCEECVDLRLLRATVAHNICWLADLSFMNGLAGWAWELLRSHFLGDRVVDQSIESSTS